MAKPLIPQPKKTFKHKVELTRGARKLAGYGEQKNKYKVYRLLEKPSKTTLMEIRANYRR